MPRQVWTVFWSKNDSNYLDVKLKFFKKDDNKDFRRPGNLAMGEMDFSRVLELKNQLLIARELLVERKTCRQCWYQNCPKTWMKDSNWLTM